MFKRLVTTTTLLLLLLGTFTAQAFYLDLPVADLSGAPGSTVGWDFSLFNDSAYDLYVMNVYADGTLYGTPLNDGSGGTSALGTFSDAFFNAGGFTVLAHSTATSTTTSSPLATFAIDGTAPASAPTVTGAIKLDYVLFDPALGPGSNSMGSGTLIAQNNSAPAIASVTATAVPEPSTYALLCISLGVVGFARKKMQKHEMNQP
jgi:PEP-CTERM motif